MIDEVLGEKRFQLGAVLNGLILLNWKRDGGPFMIRRIEIKKHTNLLSAFIKAPGLFSLPGKTDYLHDFLPESYISLLRHCTVFEAVGKIDFDRAAEFCLDFLKGKLNL